MNRVPILVVAAVSPAAAEIPPVLAGRYPRAFFFRSSEGLAANPLDRGLVLANPSPRDCTFDLVELLPGRK